MIRSCRRYTNREGLCKLGPPPAPKDLRRPGIDFGDEGLERGTERDGTRSDQAEQEACDDLAAVVGCDRAVVQYGVDRFGRLGELRIGQARIAVGLSTTNRRRC